MNFFLDDPMNSFVENLLMKSTEKAKKKKPAPGKYNPYDDSPLLAPTSHDGKDPGTPQYGKHWSRHTPRARMAENQMKRRKELQLVLDTIEEKAKKEPKPTKTPKPPRFRGESAAERIKRVIEELAKLRGSSTKQLSGGERDVAWLAWGGNAGRSWAASKVAVAQKAKKTIIVVPPFPKEGHDYVNGVNIPHRLDRYKRPMTRYEDGSYGSEPLKRREPVKSKDGPTPPSSNKGNRLRNDAVKTTMPDRSVKYVDKRKRR